MSTGMKIILILVIALIVFLFFIKDYNREEVKYKEIIIGDSDLKVAIADNMFLRRKGLSDKNSLPENQGMLFIFKSPAKYSFWMKGMKFPIDIIWIDKDKKIIQFNERISKDSSKKFKPKTAIKYVLEVNSGFIKNNNLKIGDKLIFKK